MKEYLLYSYTLTFIIDANFLLKKISCFPGEAYNIILTRGGVSGIVFNKLQKSTEKKAVTINYKLSNQLIIIIDFKANIDQNSVKLV